MMTFIIISIIIIIMIIIIISVPCLTLLRYRKLLVAKQCKLAASKQHNFDGLAVNKTN